MEQTSSNSYGNIFRGMKIFGGVQAFQMAVSLLRGKFVAIFLGQTGMGVSALFTSSAATIQQLASLGVPVATARDVAVLGEDTDTRLRLQRLVAAARLATFFTGLCAALFCALFSVLLSRLTFGSDSWSFSFLLIGAVVWLQMTGSNEVAIMQGMRELKRLSRSSVLASAVGLCAAVPMYWVYGISAIVPALAVMALIACAVYRYNCVKALREAGVRMSCKIPIKELWPVSRRLLGFGMVLTMAGVLTQAAVYGVNVFVGYVGTYDDLGYYSAGTSVGNQCVAMIFAAMAMDYFPRLMKCIDNPAQWQQTVRRQAELVALLAAPIAVALMLAAPLVIEVLFTDSFLPMTAMLQWMSAGMFMRSLSYPLGYITLAKGNRMLYFCLEGLGCNAVFATAMCLSYLIWGIDGFGIATVVVYSADTVLYYIVARQVYGFRYGSSCRRILPVCMLLVGLSLIAVLILSGITARIVSSIVLTITVLWAARKLRSLLRG